MCERDVKTSLRWSYNYICMDLCNLQIRTSYLINHIKSNSALGSWLANEEIKHALVHHIHTWYGNLIFHKAARLPLVWWTPWSTISTPHRRNLGAPRAQGKNWLPATVEPAYNTRSAYLCLRVRWPVDTRGSRRTPSGPPFCASTSTGERQGSNKDGWHTGKTSFRKPVSHVIFVESEGGACRKRKWSKLRSVLASKRD